MSLAEFRPARLAQWALAAAAALFVLWLSDFWTFVFTGAVATGLIVLSVGIVYGRTGMVSLCQVTFAGVGVWVVAWLNVHADLPFVVMLVLGGAAAVPCGLVIGLLSLRLRGVNLAVATLGFAAAAQVVLRRNPFPGSFSNDIIERPGGFESENLYFVFCCIVFAAAVAVLAIVARTRVGRAWLAVRQSERATASLGLNVAWVKLVAFSVGAFMAGIAGGLLAGQNGFLSNRSFEPFDSLVIFAVSVLTGGRFVDGALAGGVMNSVVPELFREWGVPLDVAPMIFGVGAIVILSQGADGAHGQLRKTWAAWRARRSDPREAEERAADVPVQLAPAAASTAGAALVLDRVSVSYGAVQALDGVSLRVDPSQVHGLIGPNGAGKSTLIDAATGFAPLRTGSIALGTTDLAGMAVHQRAKLGVRRTFQQGRALVDMRVGEYLRFASGRALSDSRADELLAFFGCPAADRPLASVDVGARRIVELAAAIASSPSVVMLDEPGAGLAEAASEALAKRIAEVPSRFGCGVLLVEHDMAMVRVACDEVTVLDFGNVIASGDPDEVLVDDRVVSAYLGVPEGASL